MTNKIEQITDTLRDAQASSIQLPVTRFTTNPLWDKAGWNGTTFKWNPASENPPIMGLCFRDEEAGRELFRQWIDECGSQDTLEEIRVCIIEGEIPGQNPGYSVHISPDPENALVRATAEGIVFANNPLVMLGRVSRMHPVPASVPMLPRFKEEYQRHGQFLLAPLVSRPDGQRYMDIRLGIIKTVIHFRNAAEIGEDDIDAVVLGPQAIVRALAGGKGD